MLRAQDVLIEEVVMPGTAGRIAWRVSMRGYSATGIATFSTAVEVALDCLSGSDGQIYRQALGSSPTLYEPSP